MNEQDLKTFRPAERLDFFTNSILDRVVGIGAQPDFEEALQEAIGGVLNGLTDEQQADLYARIVTGYKLVALGQATLPTLVRYELSRTNLWGAVHA